MKLSKLIHFRNLRVQKLTTLQKAVRILTVLALFCLAMAAFCFIYEKDYDGGAYVGEITEDFYEHITVNVYNAPLYIHQSEDDNIRVSYCSETEVEVFDKGGRLFINQSDSFVISLFAKEQFHYRIDIYLPQRELKSLRLFSTGADITADNLSAYMLDIRCKNNKSRLGRISCSGKLNINLDNVTAEATVDDFTGGELLALDSNVKLSFLHNTGISSVYSGRIYVNGNAYSDTDDSADTVLTVENINSSSRINITRP